MTSTGFLASLNQYTLWIGVIIIAVALFWFLRKRSNRHPMEGRQERNVGADLDAGRQAPDHSPRV